MTGRRWPGPAELADYIADKAKAKNQFSNGRGGRCCLGHYADMCGLEYPEEQTDFRYDDKAGAARLPKGHWLLRKPTQHLTDLGPFAAPTARVEQVLVAINDKTVGFAKVIAALRTLEGPT